MQYSIWAAHYLFAEVDLISNFTQEKFMKVFDPNIFFICRTKKFLNEAYTPVFQCPIQMDKGVCGSKFPFLFLKLDNPELLTLLIISDP